MNESLTCLERHGGVNDDRIFIFRSTIPLNPVLRFKRKTVVKFHILYVQCHCCQTLMLLLCLVTSFSVLKIWICISSDWTWDLSVTVERKIYSKQRLSFQDVSTHSYSFRQQYGVFCPFLGLYSFVNVLHPHLLSYRIVSTWGWINDARIFTFVWTVSVDSLILHILKKPNDLLAQTPTLHHFVQKLCSWKPKS